MKSAALKLALTALFAVTSPLAAHAAMIVQQPIATYSFTLSNVWDLTLTEISATRWNYSIVADAAHRPTSNMSFLEVDAVGVPTATGGSVTSLGVTGTAVTNANWGASNSSQYFYATSNGASALMADGSNVLNGTILFGSASSPYIVFSFYGGESMVNINWSSGRVLPIVPVAQASVTPNAEVPEPATLSLVALGLLGAAGCTAQARGLSAAARHPRRTASLDL